MTFELKKDGKRILVICLASLLIPVNTKTFVRTGDLFPGGVMGITILLQHIGETFFGVEIPYTVVNLLLLRRVIQVAVIGLLLLRLIL